MFGFDLLRHYAPAVFGNRWVALVLTVSVSALALFVLLSAYYRLTNARLTRRQVLPGAIIGAFFLELTLQGLPLFVFGQAILSPCRPSARRFSCSSGST